MSAFDISMITLIAGTTSAALLMRAYGLRKLALLINRLTRP